MISEKNKWGGRRSGSGRKKTGRQVIFKTKTISGFSDEILELKCRAKASGKSLNKYIKDILIDPNFKNSIESFSISSTAGRKYVNVTVNATEEEFSRIMELANHSEKTFGRWALDKILY